jgi:hypothetical protein
MSRSRYRPKGRHNQPAWWTNLHETRPLRRAFKRFTQKVMKSVDLHTLVEPVERLRIDFWL